MKKILIIFVIIGMTITLFYACKKNTDLMQTNNNTEQQYTDYEWEVFYKLQSFKQKLNSNLKGTDPMTLDSAEWYLETNYNVDEARTEEPYRITRKDSTYYVLPLNSNGLVEFDDMNTMYNQMLSDLDSLEIVIADPDIIPVFAILNVLTSNADEAELMLITGFGYYYSGNYAPFYDDDDWKFGNMLGHCDGTNQWESDGGQELKERLNNPFFTWSDPGSFSDYVERIVHYYDYPDFYNEHPQPNDVNYFVYFEITNGDTTCLENEELDFYLDKAHDIIYTYDNNYLPGSDTLYGQRPPGKTYSHFSIWTPDTTLPNGNIWWEHRYFIHYATRINLPLPLGQ